MVAMMLALINFNNGCVSIVKFSSTKIIAAISWPPTLISQLFSPRIFKAALFFTAWLFLSGFYFFFVFSKSRL